MTDPSEIHEWTDADGTRHLSIVLSPAVLDRIDAHIIHDLSGAVEDLASWMANPAGPEGGDG